jgi:hypothetical protein
MGAIERDFHATQIELVREGVLAELDITPAGIVNALRLAEPGRRLAAHGLI